MPANSKVDVALSFLAWLTGAESAREANYRLFREYYEGDHPTQLTDRMREYLQVGTGADFRSNYCPIVVDALAERLQVTGIECAGQSEVMWEWWARSRLDAVQLVLHTATIRDADAYLLAEWDEENNRPCFFFEPAFDGGEGVKVVYNDATNRPQAAVKRWRVQNGAGAGYVRRMNVYYPERVEKYVSNEREQQGQWQKFIDEGDERWPLPWTRTGQVGGEPLGLPVIHFRNRDQGYNYGQSELKDVVPLQDALNKTVIDLLAAADTTAFRIYTMVGDDPVNVKVSPGSWVYSTRPAAGPESANIGYFPGEDLSNLIGLKDSFAIEIARVSRTPVSYFQISGQRPAEGTLKQEESGLVGRAKARQTSFGNAWEDAFSLARRLWNAFATGAEAGKLDETVTISVQWKDAETRNEKLLLETLQIKAALGVPKEQLWMEMGYNADDIERMQEMLAGEREQESDLGEKLLEAFERAPQVLGGTAPQAAATASATGDDEEEGDSEEVAANSSPSKGR